MSLSKNHAGASRRTLKDRVSGLIHRVIPYHWRPMHYLTELVQRRTEMRVLNGPFRGLRYTRESYGSRYLPKLLGIYESELTPYVEESCALGLSRIIDIGAAEGYYAAGMALRNPRTEVIAFEMAAEGRERLAATLNLNGLTNRVTVKGKCEVSDLREALEGSSKAATLVICDAEGYEMELLNPRKTPNLADAWILVELHEFLCRGVTDELQRRFIPTHDVRHIWQTPRSAADFPYATLYARMLPISRLAWAVGEARPERMSWLWMKPRAKSNAPCRDLLAYGR